MSDITADVAGVIDNMMTELWNFSGYVIDNYVQEFLLLMLMSVVIGFIWMVARRFLGRR